MPPRVASNGAIVKHLSFFSSRLNATPIPSKVVDLTGESSDEVSGHSSGEEEESGEESEEASDRQRRHQSSTAGTQERTARAGQASVGGRIAHSHRQVARRAQDYMVESSYMVTSVQHRPWSAGDDSSAIGVFATGIEARVAADTHYFERCASKADGWDKEWRRLPGDGMLELYGCCEEGEEDTETYTASIKRIQRRRPVAVQPRAPGSTLPQTRTFKPRHIYVVKEEQRMNVGEDDAQGFYNELGDIKSVDIHGIFTKLDDANDSACVVHENTVESLVGHADTVRDVMRNNMASFFVTDVDQMMTYSIDVEKRRLE